MLPERIGECHYCVIGTIVRVFLHMYMYGVSCCKVSSISLLHTQNFLIHYPKPLFPKDGQTLQPPSMAHEADTYHCDHTSIVYIISHSAWVMITTQTKWMSIEFQIHLTVSTEHLFMCSLLYGLWIYYLYIILWYPYCCDNNHVTAWQWIVYYVHLGEMNPNTKNLSLHHAQWRWRYSIIMSCSHFLPIM